MYIKSHLLAALRVRAAASTMRQYHGTDDRTVDGSAIPWLVGMPKACMIMSMVAFRDVTHRA